LGCLGTDVAWSRPQALPDVAAAFAVALHGLVPREGELVVRPLGVASRDLVQELANVPGGVADGQVDEVGEDLVAGGIGDDEGVGDAGEDRWRNPSGC
jgi:hypothetical protein